MSEETTAEPEKPPVIPEPEHVATMICNEMDAIKASQNSIAILRRQLKFSCEYYGVEYHDPSARKKATP